MHFGGYGFPNTPEKSLGSMFDAFGGSGSLGLGIYLKTFTEIIAKMWQTCRNKWSLNKWLQKVTKARLPEPEKEMFRLDETALREVLESALSWPFASIFQCPISLYICTIFLEIVFANESKLILSGGGRKRHKSSKEQFRPFSYAPGSPYLPKCIPRMPKWRPKEPQISLNECSCVVVRRHDCTQCVWMFVCYNMIHCAPLLRSTCGPHDYFTYVFQASLDRVKLVWRWVCISMRDDDSCITTHVLVFCFAGIPHWEA